VKQSVFFFPKNQAVHGWGQRFFVGAKFRQNPKNRIKKGIYYCHNISFSEKKFANFHPKKWEKNHHIWTLILVSYDF
jgi:hypothetical protein